MRDKIWAALANIKYKGYLIDLLVNAFQRWDRNINIFLALTSSGSIAAWAIWKKYEIIWGIIIALSQIVTVIRPYFPYYKYVKELNAKSLKIENLNIEFERLLDKLQRGKLNEDQAADIYYNLQKEGNEYFNFNDDTVFLVTQKMKLKANISMKYFLKSNYNIEITIKH
jgi:hypothetical protein